MVDVRKDVFYGEGFPFSLSSALQSYYLTSPSIPSDIGKKHTEGRT